MINMESLITENSPEFLKLSLAEQNILRLPISKKCLTAKFISPTCSVFCAEIGKDCFKFYIFGNILEEDLYSVLSQIPLKANVRLCYNNTVNQCKLSEFAEGMPTLQERYLIYGDIESLNQKFTEAVKVFEKKNSDLKVITGYENNDTNEKIIGLIKNKNTNKIQYKIMLAADDVDVTVIICNSDNELVSRRSITYSGSSYVETAQQARGKCFALLVTSFCYLEQYKLDRPIQYSVSIDNIESQRLRDFFITEDALIIQCPNSKKVCEYLKAQPRQSIIIQEDPIDLKTLKEQLI